MAQVSDHTAEGNRSGARVLTAFAANYIQQILLLIVFAVAVFLRRGTDHPIWPQDWNIAFFGLALLCLGFAAGHFFYWRRRRQDAAALRLEADDLAGRAHTLAAKMDAYTKRKKSPSA